MIPLTFSELAAKAIRQGGISGDEALSVLSLQGSDIPFGLAAANKVCRHYFGSRVSLCSILNVKSGNCSEDCAFCAQSGRFNTHAETFDLVPHEVLTDFSKQVKNWSSHAGLVTSGKSVLNKNDFDRLIQSIRQMASDTEVHASFGILDKEQARILKEAGVTTYNHNIETAREFFGQIVSTHSYDDRVSTILAVKKAGMHVCCGGILGLGETPEQRVAMAFELRGLDVDIIPLNFLDPIPGTPLGDRKPMPPLEALKSIAMFRLVNPAKDIKVCGGRWKTFGDLQSHILTSGASGILVGDLLTTQNRPIEDDFKMIDDLGLTI